MFCPGCGSEERQASQFCRACGSDLRAVRLSLERPDAITASAVSAREEIGRAVAQKIREAEDTRELKQVTDHVLPEIEKFLESPEEKRLRRMRAGIVVASIGVGVTIMMALLGSIAREADVQGFMGGAGAGIVLFFIGLGLLLNAFFFTRPRKDISDRTADARAQDVLDANNGAPAQLRGQTTSNLGQPPSSVTEHTTLHLKSDR
ncbi:MAG TPA: hypothetical protein VNG71_01530 [Pyrinomonadaceae bacterium]|nr:hypothetical protein [Pyrinomonadaceae bacterium]